jgi:hypothetical protein
MAATATAGIESVDVEVEDLASSLKHPTPGRAGYGIG